MGITEALDNIKGKVLDAAHFEILKSAYELQEKNIKQLQTNNGLLEEKVIKLEEENRHLKDTNQDLTETVAELQEKLYGFTSGAKRIELSQVAQDILKLYKKYDEICLFDEHVASELPHSKIQVKVGFDELNTTGLTESGLISPGRGIGYFLTEKGRKYLAERG
jgi:predicted nuclease with TOPRIM domain